MQATRRVMAAAVDADGCGYHAATEALIIWLCATHGETFVAAMASSPDEFDPRLLHSIKSEMQKFHDVADADSRMQSLAEMQKLLIERSRKRNSKHQHEERRLLKDQLAFYIDIIRIQAVELLNELFVMANGRLIDVLMQQVKSGDVLLIGSGSNRLDVMKDTLGMKKHGTHSIYSDLVYFAKQMRVRLQSKNISTALNPFTLTDIDADLPIGENFRLIYHDEIHSIYPSCVYDYSKLALILGYIFNLSERFPNDEIIIHFFEDLPFIRDAMVSVLSEHTALLPSGVTLCIHHYDGEVRSTLEIAGSGPRDRDYRHNIRYLIMLAQYGGKGLGSASIMTHQDVDFREFLAYRAIRAGAKFLECSIDADTLYNATFNKLLSYLVRHHGDEILSVLREIKRDSPDAEIKRWQLYETLTNVIRSICVDELSEDRCDDLSLHKRKIIYSHVSHLNVISPQLVAYMLNVAHIERCQEWAAQASAASCQYIVLTPGDSGMYEDSFAIDLHAFTQQLNLAKDSVAYILDRCFNGETLRTGLQTNNHAAMGHEPRLVAEGKLSDKSQSFQDLIRLSMSGVRRRNSLFNEVSGYVPLAHPEAEALAAVINN